MVCEIRAGLVMARQQFSHALFKRLSAKSFLVDYLPTAQAFCSSETCSPVLDGKLAYRDDDHINWFGAKRALAALPELLQSGLGN